VTASQTIGTSSKAPQSKNSGPRLKLVIRRLPPGLTETEFLTFLGDDWKIGKGKVDWFSYKLGKDSKEFVKLQFSSSELT
jgi:regulator of nonsense transcripts 3